MIKKIKYYVKNIYRKLLYRLVDFEIDSNSWTISDLQYQKSLRSRIELFSNGEVETKQPTLVQHNFEDITSYYIKHVLERIIILQEANEICDHIFDLLGSGKRNLGVKIDWHSDFINGHSWESKKRYRNVPYAPFPGGFDIKVPWELSRGYQLIRLGQAYLLTKDDKYLKEYIQQTQDWLDSNPCPYGVNWTCPMEAAIRVVNWLWAFYLFNDQVKIPKDFKKDLYKSFLNHGRYIFNNLKIEKINGNNHYISDLVGLIYLGILCPEFIESEKWLRIGTQKLWEEILRQVFADGVSFEGSTYYHRLVTELILSAVILCKNNNVVVPNKVLGRVEKMLEFTAAYTKPNGTAPVIGDADNGRLLRLGAWTEPEQEWIDHRYLLAIGACIFNREDLLFQAGDQIQEAVWHFGNIENEQLQIEKSSNYSQLFRQGGFCFLQSDKIFISTRIDTNKKYRGHLHNDHMSFELNWNGEDFIIDSGTYTYTADYKIRNYLRSSFAHNLVIVDDTELNEFNEKSAFSLNFDVKPIIREWISDLNKDYLVVEHLGYMKLKEPLISQRLFYLDKDNNRFFIIDKFKGKGLHQFNNRIHLNKGVQVIENNRKGELIFTSNEQALFCYLCCANNFQTAVENSYFSTSYGRKDENTMLVVNASMNLEGECRFGILFSEHQIDRLSVDSSFQDIIKLK